MTIEAVVIGGELQDGIGNVLPICCTPRFRAFSYSKADMHTFLSAEKNTLFAYQDETVLKVALDDGNTPDVRYRLQKENDPDSGYASSRYTRPIFTVELKDGIELGEEGVEIQYDDIERVLSAEFPRSNRKDMDFTPAPTFCCIV